MIEPNRRELSIARQYQPLGLSCRSFYFCPQPGVFPIPWESDFCIEALQKALGSCGSPEIFNTDQGSQFTSTGFSQLLKDHGITISMYGSGRCQDNLFVEQLDEPLHITACACIPSRRPKRFIPLACRVYSTSRLFICKNAPFLSRISFASWHSFPSGVIEMF